MRLVAPASLLLAFAIVPGLANAQSAPDAPLPPTAPGALPPMAPGTLPPTAPGTLPPTAPGTLPPPMPGAQPPRRSEANPPPWLKKEEPARMKLASGVTLFVLGAATTALGGGLLVEGKPRPNSGAGYYYYSSSGQYDSLDVPGVALLSSGLTMTAFSVALLNGHDGDDRFYPRNSNGMLASGMILTGMGVAGVVGASTMWFYSAYNEDDYLFAAPFMLAVSGGLLGAGVPLWVKGARPKKPKRKLWSPYEPIELDMDNPNEPLVRASPTMAMVGTGMTAAGVGIIATGIGVGVDIGNDNGDASSGLGIFITLGALLGGGTLLATGLPLLVKGAKKVPVSRAHADIVYDELVEDPAVPEVHIGPGSAQFTWQF